MTRNRVSIALALFLAAAGVVLAVAAGIAFAPPRPIAQGQEDDGAAPAEWTFMLYWSGDNNLEFRVVLNLKSMMEFGSNDRVNLVVFADRHPNDKSVRGFTDDPVGNIENFDGAKVFHVRKGELEEIADLGEVNNGDPAVLKRFVEESIAAYPARKFALILRNHGGGFKGACWDDSNGHDALTLAEIRSVLAATAPAAGGKFEMVGFDMCLCANLEVADAVAPYARYLAASEDLAYGSNYTFVMRRFMADPGMDGAGLARAYVEAYQEEHKARAVSTYSAIDLAKVPALTEAVAELGRIGAGAIEQLGKDAWYRFAEVQSNAEEYGTSGGKSGGYHLFDVIQLASMLEEAFPNTEVAAQAAAVAQAADAAIIANIRGDERPNANGLSIHFPIEETKSAPTYAKTPFAGANDWAGFVGAVTEVAKADDAPPELQPIAVNDQELAGADHAKVTSSVAGKDVESVQLVISELAGEEEFIIGSVPAEPDAEGKLEVEWDGSWFTIGDGRIDLVCPVTDWQVVDAKAEVYLAEVPVQVRMGGGGEWADALFYFRIDINDEGVAGEYDSAWVDDGEKPFELELAAGDEVRPLYLKIDAKGETTYVASDDAGDILKYAGPASLKVGYERLPAGEYAVGFVAEDYAGNADESYTRVTVK